jgi:hypothetical protein
VAVQAANHQPVNQGPNLSEQGELFARFHPVLSHVAGLFTSKSRQTSPPASAHVCLGSQSYSGTDYIFLGLAPLGGSDLRILQAIYLLASHPSNALELEVASPLSPVSARLAQGLAFSGGGNEFIRAKVLTSSIADLANASGYVPSGGGSRKIISEALSRLASITVVVKQNGTEVFRSALIASTPLDPSVDGIGNGADTIAIALSPGLSSPLLAGSKAGFVRIPHADIQALSNIEGGKNLDSARLIYVRLCGFINPGQEKKVSAATLAVYAFGEAASKDTARRQYQNVRDALENLKAIGWAATGDARKSGDRVYTIKRPSPAAK